MSSQIVKDWRRRTKERLVQAFGSECGICGYNKSFEAFDFHHLDPSEKDFSFAGARANPVSWPKLVVEARKCVMLCANCHREVHAGVAEISDGVRRFDESFEEYEDPRRIHKKHPCKVCAELTYNKFYCSYDCDKKDREKVAWDSVDLVELKRDMSNVAIAKMLGVSEAVIRKRLRKTYSGVV